MLPPASHPFWKDASPTEIARRRARLRLSVDGVEMSSGTGPQSEPTDATPEIGAMPPNSPELKKFTGRILATRLVRIAAP